MDEGELSGTVLDLLFEVFNFEGGVMVHSPSYPLHFVLVDFADIANAFKNVSNIIDSPLLYS